MSSPNSLVARTLKAKYYPNNSVLEAPINSGVSFLWQSIMASKDLLRKGTRWRIGRGDSVSVMNDA